MNINDLNTKELSTWCPGCGNFPLLAALKTAVVELGVSQNEIVVAGDIGCSGKESYWVKVNSFGGLHGRVIPLAEGIKMGNPALTVIADGGDGGIYGEGVNHLIAACRRNNDFTVLVHNNNVYALTTGQTSPTSIQGFRTKSHPKGVTDLPVNPICLALTAGATFVARGFASDIKHLSGIIKEAVSHKGFSIVDVLQPCVTFNHEQTNEFYKQNVYKLENTKHDYSDFNLAFRKGAEWPNIYKNESDGKIPIGIFYRTDRSQYPLKPLVLQSLDFDIKKVIAAI